MTSQEKSIYWMADEPMALVNKLSDFHGQWSIWGSNPICQAWVRNSIAYYSVILDPAAWDTSLGFEGSQGELVKMAVPQARSLLRQLVTLNTKSKLSFNCMAESEGADVVQEVRLGNALADQIVEQQQCNRKGELLCEQALVLGMAFLKTTWRTDIGKQHAVGDNGELIYTGGLDISVYSVFDMFYDYTIEDMENLDWMEVRTIKSRWNLIAQYPELEQEIMAMPTIKDWRGPHSSQYRTIGEKDYVFVYEVYHKPTPALPKGRMLMYGSHDAIFHDGPNEYGCIPISVMKPEPIIGMGFGYPLFSNMLPAQEMLDHSFSAIATNQSAFAVQNVTVPRGGGISVDEIGGMNFISFTPQNVPGGGKPEALQLTQSSPETFKFIDVLLAHMQQVSNINSALRGTPPPGVTSGVAIATLSTNSLEFMNSIAKSYQECWEKAMMQAINATRQFCKIPDLVRLVGKNFKTYNKEFVGSDLDPIKAVKIVTSNPLMQTMAGRTSIAEQLISNGLIKTTQDYISILEGAPLKTLYETELSENDLVQSENEALLEGKPVIALNTDDHAEHIRKHAGLLNDPVLRFNNNFVGAILNHIEEHLQLSQSVDPQLMAMVRTGKPPMGPPPGAGMPPPHPPGPGGPPPGLPPLPGAAGAEAAPAGQKVANPAPDMLGRK